ncbi:HNH endonuclease [Thalassomonas viridans]|uniref:HNH endonuclease n=1 Tax=Thalassomonas viridans TaxID=137584 RepID=A0AAF0C9G0_9GAMM|nr:HNH endonuclease [Thalassomonas viridans]WDE05431.1 HNH endonuclease [Thalassomonas viridans]
MLKVREIVPKRNFVEKKGHYREYRPDLRKDFNGACGYCDDNDEFQDKSTFHIDHFAPKSKFPELELEYENLVYSCRFCNVAKSNKWISNDAEISHNGVKGFIDPCDDNYDEHIYRDFKGAINAKSSIGAYLVKELNLGLIRHEYLWKARKLRAQKLKLEEILPRLPKDSKARVDVLEAIVDLVREYETYFSWACR